VLLTVAVAFSLVGLAAPANALPALVCNGIGFVTHVDHGDGTWGWHNEFVGTCEGDRFGPYVLEAVGNGSSTGLGLCDGLLVFNLNIRETVALISLLPGASRLVREVWSSPITTFPLATPFLTFTPTGGLTGAGAMLTRSGVSCPPSGVPTATFLQWRLEL
jgi:hypothetical protein